MSYVDAIYVKEHSKICVAERVDNVRKLHEYPAEYIFYYNDPKGKFKSVYGNSVSQFVTKSSNEFYKELKIQSTKQLYESDINPVFRFLSKHRKDAVAPKLHTLFFDIEVDFCQERGFAPPFDPFNKITAISLYMDWADKLVCLVIPPTSMSKETAEEIVDEFDDTYLFYNEKEMLLAFLDLIEDADVLSGWNSEGFDIPYIVNRVTKVLSKNDTRRFCLWDKFPKKRTFERYGAEQQTFDLIGRIHMDYMQLYIKYTYHEMHSYALDAIAEHELDEHKVPYEGTLDQLYNQDFKKFIGYSRQDTMLVAKLDKKLKFLDLANEIAHANTVLIPSTMGAVAVTEQAIINEAHERGFVVPDKKKGKDKNTQAAGAYVATPKKGIHKWVGSVDINSLYPSVIRALNMAPETIIGQLRHIMTDHYIKGKMADQIIAEGKRKGKSRKGNTFAAAWEGLFGTLEYTAVMEQKPGVEITVDWENGDETIHSASELYNIVFDPKSNWALSANGTIFSYDKKGIIPGLLERWYSERIVMQNKKREATTPEDIAFWDKRQLVKKIGLNSLYGAILNPHCRFFDKRIGQSTTLTGRAIAQHMDAYVNECLTGKYKHDGECIIYGDTDSSYFSAWPVLKDSIASGDQEWNKDLATQLYEELANKVNISFPQYMERAHHTPRDKGEIIKCGREVTGESGLFITKKRYAILVYDNEGKRYDSEDSPGKVKAMGLDLKRSDTPPIVQDFLSVILFDVLTGESREHIIEKIKEFKHQFNDKPSWEKGTPKRVNNLTKYNAISKDPKNIKMIPGHVRAAINYNYLRELNNDNYSMQITDGMKTIVCKLKPNPLNYTSIGLPIDEHNIPDWYKKLPFDDLLMEEGIVSKKIENLLGVLEWDITASTDINSTFDSLFEF